MLRGEADVAGHVHEGDTGDEELFQGAVEGVAVDHVLLFAKGVVEDIDGGEFGREAEDYAFEIGGGRIVFFEEEFLQTAVGEAVEEDGAGGQAIAAGAADLLVVGLYRSGQSYVDYGADIGLVDAHAEGYGGYHDIQFP